MRWREMAWVRRLSWRGRTAVLVALLAGGMVAAPAITNALWAHGRRAGPHGWHRHGLNTERGRQHAARMTRWMLRSVDATPEQQEQVAALVESSTVRLARAQEKHRELRERLQAELAAPTIDREALDQLRMDAMRLAESTSIELVDVVASIAEILTSEQRSELLVKAEHWHH